MFHEGDLQSGIALAIQQSKCVACFVRDDDSDSTEWENKWLQDTEVSQLLQPQSVILRIQHGSQEAGFLSAFCPVSEAPALVLIQNGQLLDLITKGISQAELNLRVQKALGSKNSVASEQAEPADESVGDVAVRNQQPETAPVAHSPPTVPQPTPPTPSSQTQRQESNDTSKAKGKQRQIDPPEPAPSESTTPASSSRNDWLEQQRQRKQEARRERERVMAQIEADKAERRARREQEKIAREQAAAETDVTSSALPARSRNNKSSKATVSNLQVRLLDGGQIRKQFPAEATLEKDVRPWIDSNLETKAPYTFKQILAPQPARTISVGEEHSSLRDLELLPSATLVLQPIDSYSDAYAPASGGLLSLPYNAVTGAYGLVSGAAGWLSGALFRPEDTPDGTAGHSLRQATSSEQSEESASQADNSERPAARSAPRNNIRVRTLADQRDGAADQFYNGNSLDFQPNTDGSAPR